MSREERDRIAKQVREFRAYLRRRYARDPKVRHGWASSIRAAVKRFT